MREIYLLWLALLLAMAADIRYAMAQEPAPLDGIRVPADHPRIGMTAAELPALREKLQSESMQDLAGMLRAEAQTARQLMDPAKPFDVFRGQSRRFRATALLECAAFYALLGEDAEYAAALSAFLEQFDDASFIAELPENDFMSRGEFLEGLAVCLDWAWPVLSDKARANLTAMVIRHATMNYRGFVDKKSWEATTEANNHSVAAMGGVGLAGLALWHEHPDAPRWARLARDKMTAYLATSFDEGGAAYEGNMYGPFGLSRILPFADSLTRMGHPDVFGKGRLTGIVDCLIAEIVPGGEFMLPINDTDGNYRAWPGVIYLYCASKYQHGPARWVWEEQCQRRPGSSGHAVPFAILWETGSPAPVAPTKLVHVTPGRGLLTVRTGWGENDFLASFEAGQRRKGCHCQGDQGHFQIFAHGEYLAADTGYNNIDKEDSINQSLGHNLALIDGKGQAVSGCGKIVEATMTTVHTEGSVTLAQADLAAAYGRDNYNTLQTARRIWLCLAGDRPYVIVIDNFVKDGKEHGFTFLLQGFKDSTFELREDRALHHAGEATLAIVPCPYDKIKPAFATRRTPSSNFGEHETLEINATGKRWLAAVVLIPLAKDEAAPAVQSAVNSKKQVISVRRGEAEDEIQFAPDAKGLIMEIKITRKHGDDITEKRSIKIK